MTDLKVVSLFAGVGGIDRAMEQAGATTALVCELDPHARKILARHFPDAAIHNDVTELTADDLRAAGAVPWRTVLTAGFPCQDLSVAGRRRGMGEGTRSGLYWHVDRLLAEFRPAWVILENVPGLLSAACPCPGDGTCSDTCPGELHAVTGGVCDGGCIASHGGTMGAVLGSLAERGYGFAYRVLDARHFGVPQRRRRVVIVGRLGDTGAAAAQVLLEPDGVPGNPAQDITPRSHAARRSAGGSRACGAIGVLGDHAHTLTAEGADASEDGTGRGTPIVAFSHTAGLDVQPSASVVPTLKAGHNSMPSVMYTPDIANSLMAHGGNDKHDPTMMTYVAHDVSTVTAAGGDRGYRVDAETAAGGKPGQGYPAVASSTVVRRLTPLECERLQGFPDGWTDGQADSHRYKQLGNSVAVPVFEWVGRRLVAVDNHLSLIPLESS